LTVILWWMDLIFVLIFAGEAVLKIWAYGVKLYFIKPWNRFDFFIVIAGIISLFPLTGVGLSLFRLIRIGRLLRLVNKASTLRLLFMTLIYAAPSLWNIGILIFVIFYVYAIIGMALFGQDSCGYDEAPDGRCDDDFDKVNFANWDSAMSLLFRVATEDGWTDVYATYQEWAGGRQWQVTVYFCTFFLLGTMIIINLFIAVVLDVFADNKEDAEQFNELAQIFNWRDEWKKCDPTATGKISASEFVETIKRAPKPAGIGNPDATPEEVAEFLYTLYLLTSVEESDDYTQYFCDLIGGFSSLCCKNSSVKMKQTESEVPSNWIVEYEAAVAALCMHVLIEIGKLDVPIIIQPEEDERYIVDWYCKVEVERPGLIDEIQRNLEAAETRKAEAKKEFYKQEIEAGHGTYTGIKRAPTQQYWDVTTRDKEALGIDDASDQETVFE